MRMLMIMKIMRMLKIMKIMKIMRMLRIMKIMRMLTIMTMLMFSPSHKHSGFSGSRSRVLSLCCRGLRTTPDVHHVHHVHHDH